MDLRACGPEGCLHRSEYRLCNPIWVLLDGLRRLRTLIRRKEDGKTHKMATLRYNGDRCHDPAL